MHPLLEQYLKDVEARLSNKTATERSDILTALRRQLSESLERHRGDADAVMAELDDPSDYGELPDPEPGRGPSGYHWFVLAVAFLVVNLGGWFFLGGPRETVRHVTREEPAASAATQSAAVVATEVPPLELLEVRQADLSPSREATLWLSFNFPPDTRRFEQYVHLNTSTTTGLSFEVVGGVHSNIALLKTAMVDQDQVEVVIDAGLPADSGAAPLERQVRRPVAVTDQLQLQRISAESPSFEQPFVDVSFNSSLDLASARDFIDIQPAVAFVVEPAGWWSSGCRIRGNFQPGGVYTIQLKAGLRAENGSSITRALVRKVQLPSRPPALAFPTTGQYLSPGGKLLVPLSAVNVPAVEITAEPILPQNIVQYVSRTSGRVSGFYGEAADQLTGNGITVTNRLAMRPDQETRRAIRLRDIIGEEPRGGYLVTASAEKASSATQIVIITDLGISARETADGFFVRVNSLATARPVAGARIAAFSANNEELATGETATDGVARLDLADGKAPFVVTAQLGEDFCYLGLDASAVTVSTGGQRAFLDGGYEASLFTDRGIYRPGEDIHVEAIVRDGKLECPAPFPVVFQVVKPDGKIFRELPGKLDPAGAAVTNVTAADFLPTGLYQIRLRLPGSDEDMGSTTVAVEEFAPPQIRVGIVGNPAETNAEPFTFDVNSQHLFGRPAAGLTVSGRVQFETDKFASKAWPGFKFGDPEKSFSPGLVELGQGALDENGVGRFTVTPSANWRPPSRVKAVLGATVIEGGGRAVSAYASTLVNVYPYYIGLKAPEGPVRVGATQSVDIVAITPSGAAAFTNGALKRVLFRSEWNTVLKRGANGRYGYESSETLTPIQEELVGMGAGTTRHAYSVDAAGSYLLVVSDPSTGASASYRFQAANRDEPWVDWNREKPETIDLELDKTLYAPGETARLRVRAPFAGSAWFTLETDRILEQRQVELGANAGEIEIPVRADYAPNVYCTLTLIRPAVAESTWSAHRAVGAASIRVRPPGHALRVELQAPETNRPQSALSLRVAVRDEWDRPAQASVTAMAVDEGICMLTDFQTPSPLDYFLAPRWLGTSWYDLYGELMPVIDDELNGANSHAGGGAGASLMRRLNPIKAQRFKPVALWKSEIMTDSNGEARVEFDVPEFTGELRLMAVAVTREAMGSADRPVKVKRPLVVEPSLPRFLAPGDRSEASVQVFNETGSNQAVQIQVSCGGMLSSAEPVRTVELPAGGSSLQRFQLEGGQAPGKGWCVVDVSAGAESFSEKTEIAVRPASAEQVESQIGAIPAGGQIDVPLPSSFMPSTVENRITCSGQPDVKLARALDYLLQYPYGCVEQTTSAAFPLLRLPDLVNRLQSDRMGREETEQFVRAGILRIISMQQPAGGFSMWPNGRSTWAYGSLYATHFLVEAKAAGFDVPQDQLDAALRFVRSRLETRPPAEPDPENADWQTDMEQRAYACRILALGKQSDGGWAARLAEQEAQLSTITRVHLAAALILSGEPRRGGEMLQRLAVRGSISTAETALRLLAWLDFDPANPMVVELARRLESAQSSGHWLTTHDDALSLLALGTYAARTQQNQQPFNAVLVSAGEARPFSSSEPLVSTNTVAFAITNRGPGVVYYTVQSAGVPLDGSVEERDDGLSVRRTFLDRNGDEWDGSEFSQGDLAVLRITVSAPETVDDVVIEDLLPAGFEIENPSLLTSQRLPWMSERADWCIHQEMRDDRMLLFTGPIRGTETFYYAVRVVTPGTFVLPAITASAMYDPAVRSVSGRSEVTVQP